MREQLGPPRNYDYHYHCALTEVLGRAAEGVCGLFGAQTFLRESEVCYPNVTCMQVSHDGGGGLLGLGLRCVYAAGRVE